jgi:hypothetical protein
VNGDGGITLRDAQLLRQNLSGISPIKDPEALSRADFDLDGVVSERDSELLADTLLMGKIPSAIYPEEGVPGTSFTIHSPVLLDPAAKVSIRFAGAKEVTPPRLLLGQIGGMVPLDVLSPGTFSTNGGDIAVHLVVDGVIKQSFLFKVLPTGPVNTEEVMVKLMTVLQGAPVVAAIASRQFEELAKTPEAIAFGFTRTDEAMLKALANESAQSQSALAALLLSKTKKFTPIQREMVARLALAGGIIELNEQIEKLLAARALQGGSSAQARVIAGPKILATLCSIQETLKILSWTRTVAKYSVAALTVGSIVAVALPEPILDGPALAALATAIAKYYTASEVYELAMELVPKPGENLVLELSPSGILAPGDSATLNAFLPISSISNICSVALTTGSGKLQEMIIKRITLKYFKSGVGLSELGKYKDKLGIGTQELFKKITDYLGTVAGVIVAPLEDLMKNLAGNICSHFETSFNRIEVNAGLVTASVTPPGPTMVRNAGGAGWTFTCDDTGGSTTTVHSILASLQLCSKKVEGSATVTCGTVKVVTITMGDNGAANDDIYEVVINGSSVLTSSVPVRSVSTNLELAPGSYEFEMRGLAAPDGIGTYFVNVSGGTLTGGPPLSGRDLTAGSVFRWTLVVGP